MLFIVFVLLVYLLVDILSLESSSRGLSLQYWLCGQFKLTFLWEHSYSLSTRVHEFFGHVRHTVFPREFAWWVEIPSFIFLRCWEVVGAPLAFLVSRPPDFTAKSRDSEIASTLTTKRTPRFAARWLNSSQKLLLCSKNQQNFRDLKNIASSPRYGDFSERGHKIHRSA